MRTSWKLIPLILSFCIIAGVGLLRNVSYAQPAGPMQAPCPTSVPTFTPVPTNTLVPTATPSETPEPLAPRRVQTQAPCVTDTPTPTSTSTPGGAFENWSGTVVVPGINITTTTALLPLSGVNVNINGVTAQSDANGQFGIFAPYEVGTRHVIQAEKAGYLPYSEIHLGDAVNDMLIVLQPTQLFNIDPTRPIDVLDNRGTRILIDANQLVDADGNLATDLLQLSMYTYDLTREEMVGDMSGINQAGELVAMESAGAFYAEFVDLNGRTYNLAPGAEAEISIPSSQGTTVREGLTLWSYNEASGLWEEEADATEENGRYVGRVSHFSFWNFDWEFNSPACIQLTIDADYLAANTPPPIRIQAIMQTTPARTFFLDLNEPTNALYNLPANTDVEFYMPPYNKPPFAIINSGAPWGGVGTPPFPYDVCGGVADFSGRGTVQGMKYHDRNGNGIKEAAEPGLPGWTIEFYDEADILVASAITGENGRYAADLESGSYRVSEVPQADWRQTFPAEPGSHTVDVGIGGTVDNIDFGNQYMAESCGATDVVFVIDDTFSMDGEIENVKIGLDVIVNRVIGSSGGDYQLGLVTFKDNVTVHDVLAAGNVTSVQANIGSLEASGGGGFPEASDEALNTVINNLAADGRRQNVDFNGVWRSEARKLIILVTDAPPAGFDYIYNEEDDINANMRAVEAGNARIQIAALHTGRDADATSVMENYASTTGGTYVELSTDGSGTADAINEIIKECKTNSGEIRGTKWHDENNNGVQDDGETGLAGWTILLDDEEGTVVSTTTDTDGNYAFVDLFEGTYNVAEANEPGWTQTYPSSASHNLSLASDEIVENIDFGNWQNSDESCHVGWDINVFNDDPDNTVEVGMRIYNRSGADANYALDVVGYPGFTVHGFTATTPFDSTQPDPTPPVFVPSNGSVYVAVFMSPLPTFTESSGRYQVIATNEETGYSFSCSAQLWQDDRIRITPKDGILEKPIRPGIAQEIVFEMHNLVDRELIADTTIEDMFGLPGVELEVIRLDGQTPGTNLFDTFTIPARGMVEVVVNVELTEDTPTGSGDIILYADIDGGGPDAAASVLVYQTDEEAANVYITPADGTITVSDLYTVEIRIDNIESLYANDLEISFDPNIVEVVGTQLQHGDFFNQDVVLQNNVDNVGGIIQYSTSFQGSENPGADGSGVLAYITMRGLAPGTTSFSIDRVLLSDPGSQQIEATQRGAEVTVEPNLRYTVAGRVILERRGDNNNSGAEVCVDTTCVTTGDDGTYTLNDMPAEGIITVKRDSYLRSFYDYTPFDPARVSRSTREVTQETITFPDVTLLGGDINQDGVINIEDGVLAGRARNSTSADANWDADADITDDGTVNLLDMVAVQFNWNEEAPVQWDPKIPSVLNEDIAATPLDENAATVVAVSPVDATIDDLDSIVDVDIIVENVTDLYGFTVVLGFDPTKIQVVDADLSQEGVQIQIGDLLDPNNQFVLVNQADNDSGRIELSITQTAPAQPKSGNGTIGTVTFEAVETGQTSFELASVQLLDNNSPDPQLIPVRVIDGTVVIGTGGGVNVYLPVIAR